MPSKTPKQKKFMAANVFGVLVLTASTGSEATPFSATV